MTAAPRPGTGGARRGLHAGAAVRTAAAGVIAAVHAGRRGLAGGVAAAALEAMTGLGAQPDRIYAAVGPSICPEHYEVPAAMRDEVDGARARLGRDDVVGHAGAGHPGRRCSRSCTRPASGRGWSMPQCTAEDARLLLLSPRRRDRPLRRAGVARAVSRRDELAANLAAVRDADRRRALRRPDATRPRSRSSP